MKRIIFFCIVMTLSGCSTCSFKVVDCTTIYHLKSSAISGDYFVRVNAIRDNGFGKLYYRLAPDQRFVNFYNRWQPAEYFRGGTCPNGL